MYGSLIVVSDIRVYNYDLLFFAINSHLMNMKTNNGV